MLTSEQKSGQLYKHFLSVADTRDNRDFYEESIQSSFCIRPDQLLMYGDQIPRGSDEATVAIIRSLGDGETFDYQKDETTKIPIVMYHEDYPLIKVDDGTDNAFKLVDENGDVLQNIIPFNYYRDLYNYELKTKDGKKIYFGVGDWVLDTYSGVLKFYGDVPPGVDHNNPPTISFYQYVGGTGFRQDTFGYDGIIIPITAWHISKDTYIIDGVNDIDGQKVSLESKVAQEANAVQEGYAGIFGFDGNDKNEGIAYSLESIIALTYTSTKDAVKGHDASANSDIGTILSRIKGEVDNTDIKVTFCSQNINLMEPHTLTVTGGTVSFDGGNSKVISGPTKLKDTEGNFIIVEQFNPVARLVDGEYNLSVEEDTTRGLMLYWDKEERDYLPFVNEEDDYYNFGFPIVAANGRIPPSVSIGTITLGKYNDTITPEYYGPRNYTVTVALDSGDKTKSADYVVKNKTGYFLDDILNRIISDYSTDGVLNFKGTIFLRAGSYLVSGNTLNLSKFSNLVLLGEDKGKTTINKGIVVSSDKMGLITINNLTINGTITFNSETMTLSVNDVVAKDVVSKKGTNLIYLKNTSLEKVTIKPVDGMITKTEPPTVDETTEETDSEETEDGEAGETEETPETESTEETETTESSEEPTEKPVVEEKPIDANSVAYNFIIGCIIGTVDCSTGHTFLAGNIIGSLLLYDVDDDFAKACSIQLVSNKPHQMSLVGCTVLNYANTAFTEIPHMKHFPIYSKDSDKCLEYATFDAPFYINYDQVGNTIKISLDSEYLYINEDGQLSCTINASSIHIDISTLRRNSHYEGLSPIEACPTKNLQEALIDLYGTKADLNPDGKIPLEELPDSVAYGGLLYVGTWSFEYRDNENGKKEDKYYVDGGRYPTYDDAIKNLTVDKTQKEGLEPGWFWIVASSKKDDDKPTAIQKAEAQSVKDADENEIYSDEGLVFTAGDWVIWNGTNFEKLDRAYQDAAYAVLPIYTTGEHLCWSWNSNEDGKKWGLGALELGGVTIAESFDMINQELRKLWVKKPGILSDITLEPMYDNYKTISLYDIEGTTASMKLTEGYDLLRDSRVSRFRVRTPETNPKWKSSIFVGNGCTFEATVDGEGTVFEYVPTTAEDRTKDILHISKAFDPYTEEYSGSGYWKAVYADFGGENLDDGSHKYSLSITDIKPNNSYTNDAISSTPIFGFDTIRRLDFNVDGFIGEVDDTLSYNEDAMKAAEINGYCSGVPAITEPINVVLNFIVNKAIDCLNADRLFLEVIDVTNNIIEKVPESNVAFYKDEESGRYNILVTGYVYKFPVENLCSTTQKFSARVYDVYGNSQTLDNFVVMSMNIAPGLNEFERVNSGKGLYPTVNTDRTDTCGYPFDSSLLLTDKTNMRELQKIARNYDGKVVYEYAWPDGTFTNMSEPVDYKLTDSGDEINDEGFEGTYRWVTFTKSFENGLYKDATLSENSGFTVDINVNDDIKDLYTLDKFSMVTSEKDFIIEAKLVDYSLTEDRGLTKWFNCNKPYDGFAEVGTEDGQAAMYAGSSTKFTKRITFGTMTYSGTLIFRVGIRKGSKLTVSSITVRDLI